jgi:hypothetical protein
LINRFFTIKRRSGGNVESTAGGLLLTRKKGIRGLLVNSTVSADAKFLRRVFIALVTLTALAGAMAALTTVQAMEKASPGGCHFFCE